ncbi:hypothetical protein Q8W71_30810 [Methylobacterium sp. NEAU 140]|uniref:hypothetical protein n=1 Tax=Methylobacterium sp. NEAU 140 TaxID=3064945 RepID=UPI0027366084|nr:hypothetical protein [Methylobacterium sp. NEAU 140]MDP4026984.1 hypothetical protein [Methylobacterium sp. NEAU 140]
MTPAVFLADVVHPNMVATFDKADDMRAIVNAVLTLDALVGMIHAHARMAGQTEIAAFKDDDAYREALAGISPSYRLLRDTAASLKHGELTRSRKGLARLLREPEAIEAEVNQLGFFECGDEIGGDVILIRYNHNGSPGLVRAGRVVTDTYRMLRRIVDGEAARTDENDGGTFAIMKGPP